MHADIILAYYDAALIYSTITRGPAHNSSNPYASFVQCAFAQMHILLLARGFAAKTHASARAKQTRTHFKWKAFFDSSIYEMHKLVLFICRK